MTGLERRRCGYGTMPEYKSRISASRATVAWFCVACATLIFFCTDGPAHAFQLITAAEAELPPGPVPSFGVRGSPTRLPRITMVSPTGFGAIYSPVNFKLRFTAFGGAAIDPQTVVVVYVKQQTIDITARLKPFITENGIDIPQADVPPGLHQFWVQLKDSDGRMNGHEFEFQVAK
jgi:hypothetical protein